MIVSWNWLTEYVRLDMNVEELGERLTLSGLNLESISDVGGDLAIDVEVTSNRSDCLCHVGVAREIAALHGKRLAIPDPRLAEKGKPVAELTSVAVEAPELCSRFTARVVSGVKVGESPWWLRKRLETIGVRPVSNIVDVTNYVMFECGQPLHAYDLDLLEGRRLIVRRSRPGETIKAINNRVYEVGPDMLVIADAARPVGLAGVMGGAETEIRDTTRTVLIEAARFDPIAVRRASRALGLHSPSSFRFERPIDPEATMWASRRCAELILQTAGGTLHPGVIDRDATKPRSTVIRMRSNAVERVLGIPVDPVLARDILARLGLRQTAEDAESTSYEPPSWRPDLEREIDLVEEVGRVHGYDSVPQDRAIALVSTAVAPRERIEAQVRETLAALGFDEAVTYSLVEERLAAPLGAPDGPALRIEHQSRKRESYLRRAIAPSLLVARAHNEARGRGEAELFELAQVYLPRGDALPDQPPRVSLVSGRGFREMKGVVETLAARLHCAERVTARPAELELLERGRSAELWLGADLLGHVGEISSRSRAEFDLKGPCSTAELALEVLEAHARPVPLLRPPGLQPAVARDLSLVLERDRPWSELEQTVVEAAGAILEAVEYLDTFRGAGMSEAEESVHFGMIFRHLERTLTGEEVERAVEAVVAACHRRLGARLRA